MLRAFPQNQKNISKKCLVELSQDSLGFKTKLFKDILITPGDLIFEYSECLCTKVAAF
ncbi:hypothetical protein SAMN05660776_0971 [Salegentibacter holothuriorum]|uniref:Uncharacterized protein n=1 Tax=Salegentibacter holothuriorum TaxID=241145 RepID=A0A1T5AYD1_9FLAO|nr:hypothetical protein SAMN05660776_0971 [Salegentibacter holothuriorum]